MEREKLDEFPARKKGNLVEWTDQLENWIIENYLLDCLIPPWLY